MKFYVSVIYFLIILILNILDDLMELKSRHSGKAKRLRIFNVSHYSPENSVKSAGKKTVKNKLKKKKKRKKSSTTDFSFWTK